MLEAFVSRNNDVGGYWGMGKLYSHALENNVLSVAIDLIAKSISPHTDEFAGLISQCSAALWQQCEARDIPASWIKDARINITFKFDLKQGQPPPKQTRGDLFECVFEIEDDLGHRYAASRLGWCAPHDSMWETRSARPVDAKHQT
jgi:hypothetical protein